MEIKRLCANYFWNNWFLHSFMHKSHHFTACVSHKTTVLFYCYKIRPTSLHEYFFAEHNLLKLVVGIKRDECYACYCIKKGHKVVHVPQHLMWNNIEVAHWSMTCTKVRTHVLMLSATIAWVICQYKWWGKVIYIYIYIYTPNLINTKISVIYI